MLQRMDESILSCKIHFIVMTLLTCLPMTPMHAIEGTRLDMALAEGYVMQDDRRDPARSLQMSVSRLIMVAPNK